MTRGFLLVLTLLGVLAVAWFALLSSPGSTGESDAAAWERADAQRADAQLALPGDGGPRLAPGPAAPARRGGERSLSPGGPLAAPNAPRTAPTPSALPGPSAAEQNVGVGRFEVSVRGPDGEEIASAHVNVIDVEGSRVARVVNGRLGVGLRALDRPLDLEVFGAQRADGTQPALGWAIRRIETAAAGGTFELRLPRELTIAGTVVDSSGLPVVNVEVSGDAVRNDPLGRGGSHGDLASRTRTEADGKFVLRRLGAGEITLRVAPPPDLQRAPALRTHAGTQGVHIVLERAKRVSVRVLDAAGRPVQGALVWVSVQDLDAGRLEPLSGVGFGSDNLTDAEGLWVVPHLAPDDLYRLRVEPPRGRPDLVRQELEGWKPADTTLRLAAGNFVRGFVRDPAGRPIPEASIYYRQTGRWLGGNVGRDGTFEIGGLDPGDVLLRATSAPDGLQAQVEGLPMFVETRVATGSSDVVLTVERGQMLGVQLEGWPGDRGFRKGHLFAEGLLGGRTWHVDERIGQDGRLLFKGLEPAGTYVFWLPPEGGELSALVEGIRPEAGSITVPVKPGMTISGRMTRPEGANRGVVQAFLHNRPFHIETTPEADGTFVLRGVPRGTRWRVIGACNVGQSHFHCTAEDVPAGGSVDLAPKR